MSLKRWLKGLQRARQPSRDLEEGTVLTLYTSSIRLDDWENTHTRCRCNYARAIRARAACLIYGHRLEITLTMYSNQYCQKLSV